MKKERSHCAVFLFRFIPILSKSDNLNNDLNAFGFGSGIKEKLIEAAVAANRGISITRVNNTSYLRVLEKGAVYMKYVKGVGVAGSLLSTGYSSAKTVNQYQSGGIDNVLNHRDVFDAGVGAVGLGTTALVAVGVLSNPVGWCIGAGVLIYGGATLIYDLNND